MLPACLPAILPGCLHLQRLVERVQSGRNVALSVRGLVSSSSYCAEVCPLVVSKPSHALPAQVAIHVNGFTVPTHHVRLPDNEESRDDVLEC